MKKERAFLIYIIAKNNSESSGFNIPDSNTSFLLLGQGTSITNGAIRKLAESGVLVGFTGTGGSPLLAAEDIAFLPAQTEYRPTEYMQAWIGIWTNESSRLDAAKYFLTQRIVFTTKYWAKNEDLLANNISISDAQKDRFYKKIATAKNTFDLLSAEGEWVKSLYGILAKGFTVYDFTRDTETQHKTLGKPLINSMLTHGNYVCYGYAGVTLYALGISFALPLLHGKTRRGALVFDVADLIKDGIVSPLAFTMGIQAKKDQDYRNTLIEKCQKLYVMDFMIDTIKETIEKFA